MRICQIVPSLEEIHGGPSKSVRALAGNLAAAGSDVTLLATHPTAAEHRDRERLIIEILRRDRPRWLCPSGGLRRSLNARSFDLVHHHSLWLRTLHYAHRASHRARIPLVISPRGMMSAWAWNHRRYGKLLARHLVHPGAFEAAAGWHATSEAEASDIRSLGFRQPICVAPNGVESPTTEEHGSAATYWRQLCPAIKPVRTALFYSRFHQKKRVIELIDLWLASAPPDWTLLMVGLSDEYTASQLETYVLRCSGGGRIRVFDGQGRPPPYAVASLFLLPSHSENFGLAIAEAMAHGVPVVVTDATPWTAINSVGAGWCVNWSEYPAALSAALSDPDDRRTARGQAAREHVLANYSWQQTARTLQQWYEQLIASRV